MKWIVRSACLFPKFSIGFPICQCNRDKSHCLFIWPCEHEFQSLLWNIFSLHALPVNAREYFRIYGSPVMADSYCYTFQKDKLALSFTVYIQIRNKNLFSCDLCKGHHHLVLILQARIYGDLVMACSYCCPHLLERQNFLLDFFHDIQIRYSKIGFLCM